MDCFKEQWCLENDFVHLQLGTSGPEQLGTQVQFRATNLEKKNLSKNIEKVHCMAASVQPHHLAPKDSPK